MIAAMARGRVIGTGHGGIPWHLPRDSGHFRSYTRGHHMLLGRTTFEEMSGWFTSQIPLVLTRRENYRVEGGSAAGTIEDAIAIAEAAGEDELVVSGGASIYRAALPFAHELVLTLVDADVEGSAHFPDYQAEGPW
ncbi:MAG: dihydrofolate reductase, partial [Verrucomicrobiales bacterium]